MKTEKQNIDQNPNYDFFLRYVLLLFKKPTIPCQNNHSLYVDN